MIVESDRVMSDKVKEANRNMALLIVIRGSGGGRVLLFEHTDSNQSLGTVSSHRPIVTAVMDIDPNAAKRQLRT